MKNLLESNGFIKVNNKNEWFINFQGRTYTVIKNGGKWWVIINKNGIEIKINQTGFTKFKHIQNLLESITLNKIN